MGEDDGEGVIVANKEVEDEEVETDVEVVFTLSTLLSILESTIPSFTEHKVLSLVKGKEGDCV